MKTHLFPGSFQGWAPRSPVNGTCMPSAGLLADCT